MILRGEFINSPQLWVMKSEWMVNNEEVRDILSALRCVSADFYEEIKREVYAIKEFKASMMKELGFGIKIEACLEPKQRKPSELTPYLFVLFPMDKPSKACYIVDKKGKPIKNPIRYKIKAGDRLVWAIIDLEWLREVTLGLAQLDEAHKDKVIEDIFQRVNRTRA